MVKKIGFIDLQTVETGRVVSGIGSRTPDFTFSVYVFNRSSKGYEFETTIKYDDKGISSQPSEIDGIKEYYLGLPLELLEFRMLRLPFSDKEKLDNVIPFEIDGLIIGGSGSIVSDSIVLGSTDNGFNILVVYVKKTVLEDLLSRLLLQNIDPRMITSLELPAILKGDIEDIAAQLMNRQELNAEERITAARKELETCTINLRKAPFAYTGDIEKLGKTLNATFILAILLALLIHFDIAFRIITVNKDSFSLKNEMRGIYTTLFPGEKKIADELYQLKSHLKEVQEKGGALKGVAPLGFMLNVSGNAASGVFFNEISLDREIVTMKGEAVSMDAADKMKKRLSDFLKEVTLSDIKPSADGRIFFTVIANTLK